MTKYYTIRYEYEGRKHDTIVRPDENPMYCLMSLVAAGAVITDILEGVYA